jgi:hypothetical protein
VHARIRAIAEADAAADGIAYDYRGYHQPEAVG